MRLLIVDDDAGLRQSLGLLLAESGYDVVSEGDPEDGLARATSEPFDLILCDVRMPKMDGLTFLRRYRAERGSALLIMMSAFGGEDMAIAAMREGAYDYLHKPFKPDEVTLTLRKAEERERLKREVEQLRASLATALSEAPEGSDVIVDLQNSSFCDSTGLNALLAAREEARNRGHHLLLATPSHQMIRLLELTGSADLFTLLPAVADQRE